MLTRTRQIISSWWTTASLLLMIGGCYIVFSPGEDGYTRWIRFLFHSPAGLALYLGLNLNLFSASVRMIFDRMGEKPLSPDEIRAMDVFVEFPDHDAGSLEKAAELIGLKGFPGKIRSNTVHAVKGKFSFLPGTVLRAGLIVLMTALLVSAHIRMTQTAVLHVDEDKLFFGKHIFLSGVKVRLPEDFLQVGDESLFRIERARAELFHRGKTFAVAPGFPTRINGNYYRLVHLGYTQPILLKQAGNSFAQDIDLDILPPGKTQIVGFPESSLFFTVSLEPDRTISKGLLKGKQFNLSSPFYRIVMHDGRDSRKLDTITIRPGERRIAKGVDLSLGKAGLFARIQIVHDPALAWIYLGALLTLTGLCLMLSRFFWYRKEMVAVLSGSVLSVGYREEFFKKWGIRNFHEWKNELKASIYHTKPRSHKE